MSITSVTAIIFTFRHLALSATLIMALFITLPLYWLLAKAFKKKILAFTVSFIFSLGICAFFSHSVFLQSPVSIEWVSVN